MRAKEVKEFVYRKIKLLDENTPYSNAACAKLRRAIGKPREESPDIWEITLHGAPDGEKEGIAIHTCLTLYALHSQSKVKSMCDEKTGFGAAITKLVTVENETAIQRRFNAVATSVDFAELTHHARGLIQLLRTRNIKMDYGRFAEDLFYFQTFEYAGRVRLKWGEDFYNGKFYQKKSEDEKGVDEK